MMKEDWNVLSKISSIVNSSSAQSQISRLMWLSLWQTWLILIDLNFMLPAFLGTRGSGRMGCCSSKAVCRNSSNNAVGMHFTAKWHEDDPGSIGSIILIIRVELDLWICWKSLWNVSQHDAVIIKRPLGDQVPQLFFFSLYTVCVHLVDQFGISTTTAPLNSRFWFVWSWWIFYNDSSESSCSCKAH